MIICNVVTTDILLEDQEFMRDKNGRPLECGDRVHFQENGKWLFGQVCANQHQGKVMILLGGEKTVWKQPEKLRRI